VGRLGGYYAIENYKRCDHLIVNTPDLVRHVVESGWPEDGVSMISNFGDLPSGLESHASLPDIPEGVPVLLTLGRLHVKKAQDVLIRAMPLIPEAHVLIAGDGELMDVHKQLADSLGVADRVHLLGLRKDVASLFKRADICVFPSRFEPLGNVVLEAWAMQTPIVAAASTGPSWLIEDGVNGLLFEIDAHEALADRVNTLISDSALCERLVIEGSKKLIASFSRKAVIDAYHVLFEDLLSGRIRSVKSQ
jgi:glycosyltransferase involved in cell wall biosynthesis